MWHPQEPGTARVNRAKTRDNLKNYLQFTKRWLKGNSFGQFPISRLFGSWQPDRKELGGVGAIHPALLVTSLGSRNGQGEEISGPSEGHLSLTRGLTGSLITLPYRQSEDSWEARRNEQLDRKSSIAVGAVPWPADPRTRMSSLMRWRRGVMGSSFARWNVLQAAFPCFRNRDHIRKRHQVGLKSITSCGLRSEGRGITCRAAV